MFHLSFSTSLLGPLSWPEKPMHQWGIKLEQLQFLSCHSWAKTTVALLQKFHEALRENSFFALVQEMPPSLLVRMETWHCRVYRPEANWMDVWPTMQITNGWCHSPCRCNQWPFVDNYIGGKAGGPVELSPHPAAVQAMHFSWRKNTVWKGLVWSLSHRSQFQNQDSHLSVTWRDLRKGEPKMRYNPLCVFHRLSCGCNWMEIRHFGEKKRYVGQLTKI